MATVQEQTRPSPPSKHEAYVEQQLRRARQRIRLLDTTAALVGLIIGTLAYGLGIIVLDRWLDLSPMVRQWALLGYLVAAAVYLGVALVWPLCRHVNPYYAAIRVEQTVPGAKNSIINWLDLHDQKLPGAIRSAVGARAAKDVSHADLDRAISARRLMWLGAGTVALLAGMVVALALLGPSTFFSLFGRAFGPFSGSGEGIASRTRLRLLQPTDGDLTVAVNSSVYFVVQVDGRIPDPNKPDAVRLLIRRSQDDPVYQERRFERGDTDREWVYRLPGFDLQNGFWYKVAGGDVETAEHRIQVRSSPLITAWEIKYHYRPYLCRPDEVTDKQDIEALRGTEITVRARTNRTPKRGVLHIDGAAKPLPALVDRDTLQFKFVVERTGSYRVRFTSSNDEPSGDSLTYAIKALDDVPPKVVLREPGKDITLPANGVLSLAGSASDDYGVTRITLRMRIKGGLDLLPKVYRAEDGKSFKFDDGTYPRSIDYEDFVELDKVKDDQGRILPLRPGMAIEYWLEAEDNCDYPPPGPNVGKSEVFKVTIGEPEKDKTKTKEQKAQAQQKKDDHRNNQDQQFDKQNNEQHRPNGAGNTNDQRPTKTEAEKDFENKRNDLAQRVKDREREDAAKATSADVKSQADNLNNDDPKKRDEAAHNLQNIAENAKDPQVRKEAKEALEKNGQPNDKSKPGADATPQDVQNFAEQMKNGNAEQKAQAEQQLQNIAENAKDPQARKDAQDALKQAGKPTPGGDKGANAKPQDVKNLAEQMKNGNAEQKAQAEQQLQNIAENAKDPQARKDAQDALKQAGKPTPGGDKGANAMPQDVKNLADQMKNGNADQKAQAEQKLQEIAKNAKDQQVKKGAQDALKNAGKPMPGGDDVKPGAEATPKDVQQLADQMKNGNADQKAQAEQKLQEIAKNAKDQQVKKGAQDALKNAGKPMPGGDDAKPGADAKPEDVQKLADQMKNGNGTQKDQATQKLQDIAKNAANPQAKKGAQDALKEAGKPTPGGDNGTPGADATAKDVQDLAKDLKGEGQKKDDATRKLQDIAQNAQDQGVKKAAEDALKKAGQPLASAKPGADAGPKDVQDLAKDLKGDGQKKDDAVRKLQDIASNAKDPGVKKAAEDALKKAGQTVAGNDQRKPGADGTPQDVQDLAKDLKGEGQKKDDATRKLQDIASNAEDPQARKAAEDALRKEGQPTKREPTPADVADLAKNMKNGTTQQRREATRQLQDIARNGRDPEAKKDAEEALRKEGVGVPNQDRDPLDVDLDPNEGSLPDLKNKEKAGELQLELFKEKVTPDMLQKLNMSKEEYARFLKDMEKRLAQLKSRIQDLEKAEAGGVTRPNPGIQRSGGSGTREDLQKIGQLQAPTELQKQYRDFAEALQQIKAQQEKK